MVVAAIEYATSVGESAAVLVGGLLLPGLVLFGAVARSRCDFFMKSSQFVTTPSSSRACFSFIPLKMKHHVMASSTHLLRSNC